MPIVLVVVSLWLLAAGTLLVVVWLTWCPRGRYALVVHSNSPVWQQYFETHVLPALAGRAVLLNWSERSRWKTSLPVLLFRFFGGSRNFNPLALVFRPLAWPQDFRFFPAFKACKHGRPEEVEALRQELLALLDELAAGNERETPPPDPQNR